ncbi:FkbM family methyltransferase [Fuscibacter oryzae]|uniref:FkbM family methyltransferase n=1 Tax=Fuscibacter oryzae TaxID=2803939 RepID=A0A8J7MSV5_9RHOB|nr:FkbM family methyltransferase [Fuscibacter oryzae]MBL4928330.1 FkbM family methyltransferase [Fuscibacter oryzae]
MTNTADAPTETRIVATIHGVQVPQSPHFGPAMVQSITDGRYERGEIETGLSAIPEGARILEMGTGSGIVGAVMALNRKPTAMLSVEANPNLLPQISALYQQNGLQDSITLRHGVVFSQPNPPAMVEFFVAGNFLGSGLFRPEDKKRTAVQVPVIPYDTLKAAFPHDVLMMDIEGAELDFLRHADLSGVTLFLAEFHRDIYGREGMRECRHLLDKAGFVIDDTLSRAGVHVWRRRA